MKVKAPPRNNGNPHQVWLRLGSLAVSMAVFFLCICSPAQASLMYQPLLVEFPGEAVPVWRSSGAPPVLVLLSAEPFLMPLGGPEGTAAERLFKTGTQTAIASQVNFSTSDPVLLPTQTVRMALRCGILSGLSWIVPQPSDQKEVGLAAIKAWLIGGSSFLTEKEKSTMQITPNGVVGVVEGRPFRALPLSEYKRESGPVQLHIDLSYYSSLYKNEIKTPLYVLLRSSVDQLLKGLPRDRQVTASYSTANGDVPLTLRFLAMTLKNVLVNPTLLVQKRNDVWSRRRDILYLVNFHDIDRIIALAKSNVADLPDDATTHFDLYRAYSLQKNLPLAKASLARACKLDPGYVYEYRNLAVQALDFQNSLAAIDYLRQALHLDPGNVFLKFDLGRVLLDAGKVVEARNLLKELKALSWSKIYYPELPDILSALEKISVTTSPLPVKNRSERQKPASHL